MPSRVVADTGGGGEVGLRVVRLLMGVWSSITGRKLCMKASHIALVCDVTCRQFVCQQYLYSFDKLPSDLERRLMFDNQPSSFGGQKEAKNSSTCQSC